MIEASLQLSKAEFQLQADFQVPGSGVTAIFGPSGCGKTSLLRAIAGIETEVEGSLSVNGHSWLSHQHSLAPERRRVGLIFQSPSLFEHLTIQENLLYGRNRLKLTEYSVEFKELVSELEIENLLHRYPKGLSGGETQRVALGRALLAEPKLLLMDEPLSALDQESRKKLMLILEKFLQRIDIPVLYVTHSSEEVARLADNLMLLSDGRVTDCGSIHQVLAAIDSDLGRSDAAFSVMEGRIASDQLPGLISVECGVGIDLQVPLSGAGYQVGNRARLRIRARDVSICLEQPRRTSILNILPAVIEEFAASTNQGSRLVKLDIDGKKLLSKISEYSAEQLKLEIGQSVFAQIKSASLL